eukprot:CAMPEP_0197851112 /NCGR_PEP_ID=MMETSP1438-20131217/17298_1 /TAXON_ID=1461541 /ORGANISM="Pterosperma sp., Strain CCMP1384" /LENGTH=147 /DNA_ID=CAMNT_0043464597 /DNA_START=206 /DNA_END=646 /DNA_ORIENTATION=+
MNRGRLLGGRVEGSIWSLDLAPSLTRASPFTAALDLVSWVDDLFITDRFDGPGPELFFAVGRPTTDDPPGVHLSAGVPAGCIARPDSLPPSVSIAEENTGSAFTGDEGYKGIGGRLEERNGDDISSPVGGGQVSELVRGWGAEASGG